MFFDVVGYSGSGGKSSGYTKATGEEGSPDHETGSKLQRHQWWVSCRNKLAMHESFSLSGDIV